MLEAGSTFTCSNIVNDVQLSKLKIGKMLRKVLTQYIIINTMYGQKSDESN